MANTTEDKLRAALTSKEGIRQAIESKGVECGTDVPFSAYRSKIEQLRAVRGLKMRGRFGRPFVCGTIAEKEETQ